MAGDDSTDADAELDARTAALTLRTVFLHSPEALALSRHGRLEFANPALVRLFGYGEERELLGRHVVEFFAEASRPSLLEAIAARAAGRVRGAYEGRAVRRDGSEFDAEVRTTACALGGDPYTLALLRDVTNERDAERALREHEALYRAMFELNGAVKLLIDPATGRIVDANPAAERLYGYTVSQLRQMAIHDINMLSPAEVAAELEAARTLRRGYFRFRHRTAHGEVRHVEVHSGPIAVAGRELLFSIVHDVTERDVLEEQLRQAQRLEAIGRLAGGVAHDFNNLLTVMLGCCQLLEVAQPGQPLARDALHDMRHATERAAELTQQLLAFSRRQLLSPRAISLNQVVLALEGLLRRTLGASIRVMFEVAPDVPLVRADSGQLEQVVMNLVLNGRDAMPEGGTLTLRTGAVTLSEPTSVPLPPGRYATLAVCDTGVGMDGATLSRVFEPFFTTKAAGQGTGLGLSTVYGIVTQSGGFVATRSAVGAGSEFLVYLPATSERLGVATPPAPEPNLRFPGVSVLLVEDMADVRRLLSLQLRTAGLTVHEAESAEAALALGGAVLDAVHALVSDIVLGGVSGVELARVLLARRPDLPVLLMSGDLRDHDVSHLPGTVRLLQKPFGVRTLLGELSAAIARRPAEAAT